MSPVTLGLLAGGQGTRLGGVDKAWLECEGQPQVIRLSRRYPAVTAVLVSSNSGHPRYAELGLKVVRDSHLGAGPVEGLAALAVATATPWLLTLPVDTLDPPADLLDRLLAESLADGARRGAVVHDEDGLQPLVALWPTAVLVARTTAALAAGRYAARDLVHAAGLRTVRLQGVRLGNLNTPADLAAARVSLPNGGPP